MRARLNHFGKIFLIILAIAGVTYAGGKLAPVWKAGAAAPAQRFAHAAVWNDKAKTMLIFAGEAKGEKSFIFFHDVWEYNPATNAWQEIKVTGDGPDDRAYFAAAWDSKESVMWAFGGASANAFAALDDLWKFDPAAAAWTHVTWEGKGPVARMNSSLHYLEFSQQLLVCGGSTGFAPDSALQDLWLYDIAANTWTELPAAPAPRWQFAAAVDAKHKLFILHGGFDGASLPTNDTWIYDIAKKKWTPAGNGPKTADAHAAVWDKQTGLVLCYGGTQMNDKLGISELSAFDPASGKWSALKAKGDGPGPRGYHSLVISADGALAILFGGTHNQFSDPMQDAKAWQLSLR